MSFPTFTVQSADNRALNEMVDAVSRVDDEAIFQIGTGAIRVVLIEAANVFSIDATLSSAEFSNYSAEPGAFGVKVGALSSAFNAINKTDAVRFTGDADAEEVTVEGVGPGASSSTFGMIDPDDMRDTPDLAGTVGMMDYNTAVSVPRDQFRRLVRVSDEVSDNMEMGYVPDGPGSSNMIFKTRAEGDVDDVVGYPDFEVESDRGGQASGMFTLEFIKPLSLGIPSRQIDVEIAFDGDEKPLRVSFQTGGDVGADVEYYVAPRIGADEGELVDADVPGTLLPNPNFRARLDGSKAKELIDLFNANVDERKVMFTREGVESRAVDPANVLMDAIEAEPFYFDEYEAVSGFPDDPVGLSTTRLSTLITKWTATQPVTMAFDGNVRKFSLQHPIFTARIATIDPDSIRKEPDIPTTLQLSGSGEADPTILREAISSVARGVGDEGAVGMVHTGDVLFVANEMGDRERVGLTNPRGRALSIYSGDYMETVSELIINGPDSTADVRLGNSMPLGIHSDRNDDLRSLAFLAPRIPDDDILRMDTIQNGMAGSGVDLSVYDNGDTDEEIPFFDDVREESPSQRIRRQRLSTFPITLEIQAGFGGDSARIIDGEDSAVPEETLEEVQERAVERIQGTQIESRDTVGEVTFTSETEFEIDFVDVQPDVDRRINTSDGVRFRETGRDENEYIYLSSRSDTPSRFQIDLRAVEFDGEFGVRIAHKVPKETERREEAWLDRSADTIVEAYNDLVDYIEGSTIENIVRDAGVDVELTVRETEEQIEDVLADHIGFTLEESPARFNDSFFAAIHNDGPYTPDSKYRVDISVDQPENPGGAYPVRFTLSYTVSGINAGDGALVAGEELVSDDVGKSETRAGVVELVEEAFDQIRQFSVSFARRADGGRSDEPMFVDVVSAREGDAESVREAVDAFLPDGMTKESLIAEIEDSGASVPDIPIEFDDVGGIGPARSDPFREAGLEDVIDYMALASGQGSHFFVGNLVRDLPSDPMTNLMEAGGNIWANFIWPKRELPGDFDIETAPPIQIGDDTDDDGVDLPDRIDTDRWDAVAIARPDAGFRERVDVEPIRSDQRRNPDLELTDDALETWADDVGGDVETWMYDDGDIIAVASFADDTRGGMRVATSSLNPGPDLLLERTTDDDGNLTVTAEDGWVGIHPRSLRDAEAGDLQTGWETSPIKDPAPSGLGFGTKVGWDFPGRRTLVYSELPEVPYFIRPFDEETEQMQRGLGTRNEPGRRNYAAINVTPDGDEVIGLVPDSDTGQGPAEPIYASEFEDEYELFPFFRSTDAIEETIGQTVLARTSSGFLHETEVTGSVPRAAGVRVAERDVPEGQYFIPASADHEDSTVEIIGIPTDEPDEPEPEPEAVDDIDVTERIMGELDVTRAVAEGVERELGAELPDTVEGAVEELTRRVETGEALGVPVLGMMEADELRDGVRRTQIDDEPAPEPEPDFEVPPDFPSNSVVAQFDPDAVERSAWSHAERDFDEGQLLLLNRPRDIGLLAHRVSVGGQAFAVLIGTEYNEPVPEGELRDDTHVTVTDRVSLGSFGDDNGAIVDRLMDLTPTDVQQQLVMREGPQPLPELDGGPPYLVPADQATVDAVIADARSALRDADDAISTAITLGAADQQPVLSLSAAIGHLDRAITSADAEPTQEDVSNVRDAIERVEERTEDVRELIRDAEPDAPPEETEREVPDEPPERIGELSQAEMETIVEGATEGVTANAVVIEDDLQRIRMAPDGTVPIDTTNQVTARFEETREGTVLSAIDRWETFADIDAVDTAALNEAREALNEQFDLQIPLLDDRVDATPDDAPEPEPEPDPDPDKPDVVAEMEAKFQQALTGMGLPDLENPPVEFRVDEGTGILVARPAEAPEWVASLDERPPFVQGGIDEADELLVEYIEALAESLTEPARDRLDLEAARRSVLDDTDPTDDVEDEPGVRTEPIRVVDGEYTLPEGTLPQIAADAVSQTEAVLGPAIQFEDTTRVGQAVIQDEQVAIQVEDGEQILDARRQQEDIEERDPEIDLDQPATAESIEEAFPRLFPSQGSAIEGEFDTLRDLVEAPVSVVLDVRGIGESTIESMTDTVPLDMERSILDQRDRPLGIEEDIPEDSPMPEVRPDDDPEETDLPDDMAAGVSVPEIAVTIPPTAPRGERFLAEQIQRGDRISPNRFDQNPIVEIVFPERLSDRVRRTVANNEIALGRQNRPMVQAPSFRDQFPQEAAGLKGIQFLLSNPGDPRSSGHDINGILRALEDELVIVTVSPVVRAPISFP